MNWKERSKRARISPPHHHRHRFVTFTRLDESSLSALDMNLGKQIQVLDEEQNLKIQGFQSSYLKQTLVYIGALLSCGLLWVVITWRKNVYLHCTHTPCSLEEAEKVLLIDAYGQEFVSKVKRPEKKSSLQPPFFYYKKMKYSWNGKEKKFVGVQGLDIKACSELQNFRKGLDSEEARKKLQFYGLNLIKIEVTPVITLVLREIRSPFYMYQSFIVIIWFLQLYYQFGICIIILSVISVSATVWETRKQTKSLRNAMRSESVATVYRDGKEKKISSKELVPGDVLILSQTPFTMFCDAVLISGNCVVNESMLTGESTPITKIPISEYSSALFDLQSNKRSILSCGTEILLCRSTDREGVRAIVYRTGFSTAKGELVRSILFPKPVALKLYSDLLKCMVIFFILGSIPVIYTSLVCAAIDAYPWDALLYVLNVVTFFVPPSLPAVLTSVNEQAQRRLRKQNIYCLNSRYINFAGGLDVVCFDKTGTLTEDSLDISIIVPAKDKMFETVVLNPDQLSSELLVKAMATCHSLARIDEELQGYDMDIKMFKLTGWQMQEPTVEDIVPFEYIPPRIVFPNIPGDKQPSVAIVKMFPFESSLKRTSVVTQTEGSERFQVFLKGAPELVVSLSREETVPDDVMDVLEYYSSQGFRVIAVACKNLPDGTAWKDVQNMTRDYLETELQFLGLVVFENKLKPETIPALNTLKDANIKSVMVTGDNLLTAVTVAKKCGIVEECDSVVIMKASLSTKSNSKENLEVSYKQASSPVLRNGTLRTNGDTHNMDVRLSVISGEQSHVAMEGETFNLIRMYDPDLLEKVVLKGAIFARMLPEHKLYLIECFQNLGYHVGMCGDGANDCGALKTAHTGVSLSLAEASVAAPFTSPQQNIQCIPTLIREGRATLVSTFDSFRYMVCYTFTFLLAILFLFWDGQRPSDGAYVTIDIVLNLAPPFLFGATGAYHGLSKKQPARSILSFIPCFSVASFMLIQIAVHSFAYTYCIQQTWYEPFTFDREIAFSPNASYTGTTILTTNMMTYVTGAAIFASGPPYRAPFFSNRLYVAVLVVQFVMVGYLTLAPPNFMIHFLNFKRAPVASFHIKLYAITLGVLVFCFIYEKYFIQRFLSKFVVPAIRRWRGPIRKYEKLLHALAQEDWPPSIQTATDSNAPKDS
ncbi:polyamine-transporting ATPase 13A3-like [Argiope bruennichi]|uniref:polyamine-transporting ATPase 13A3-like n=1 Tax=Argiope bruennichi TaxID=94029 RepID=UPI002494B7C8|nr:polyamine-transporting ATPase 13A3-like [Argiope bruennichi]